jgi:competence protein ComEC
MRSAILGFAVGIALLQMQAQLLAFEVHLALLAVALALCVAAWWLRRGQRYPVVCSLLRIALFSVGGVCFGFAWGGLIAQHYLDDALPLAWEGRDVTMVGTIDSLPDRFAGGVRFNFKVEHVAAQGQSMPVLPSRLALSWYDTGGARGAQVGEANEGAAAAVAKPKVTAPQVLPGQRWQLTVRLKRPHGNANPHGFDYEVWLLEQRLRATGSVRPEGQSQQRDRNHLLNDFVWSPSNVITYARSWLRTRILTALPGPGQPYAGVIVALVVGDQRAIEGSDWTIFNRTGIGHLVAISGLHITMVAGLFAALASFLWRRSFYTGAQLPLLLPAPKVAVLAGLVAALLYVLLAGFGVPAQRTLAMLLVVGVAHWSGRLLPLSYVMSLALAAVLLLDPWALLWPGFWLSFGAVAIILYASAGRLGNDVVVAPRIMSALTRARQVSSGALLWRKLRAGAMTQYVVTLGLLPLTVLLFGQYSLVSPLANAVAIPLLTLLVVPLSLLGSILPLPLATIVLQWAHDLIAWLADWLGWLSAQPFAVWHAPLPSPWMFAVALGGTLLILAPRGWPMRWLGWFGWLPLLLNGPDAPPAGLMRVTALDVGQGMALLVETGQHRLLYDTGPAYGPGADAGSRVIVPYLRARGIDHLDMIVVSHSDGDHAGGLQSVLDEISVDRVMSSLPPANPLTQVAPDHQRCLAGQEWRWDGAAFRMLYPVQALYDSDKWKPNAVSCVLKVTLGKQAVLLPGDIEARQEDQMLHSLTPADLRADVLLAPHHGSGTSSTLPFLQAVQPTLALFQVGYRNRFNHPKPEVFERYGQLGIRRLRTDEAGAMTIEFGNGPVRADSYRQSHARYWYGR